MYKNNHSWAARVCLVVLVLGIVGGNVSAQRNKDGCFDRYQLSCDENTAVVADDASINPEEICKRISSLEAFPSREALLDLAQHPGYLNDIEADSEFCGQIQQVYHLCSFCLDIHLTRCLTDTSFLFCANKPTQEELLSLHDPLFQSVDDIEHTCSQLEAAYASPELLVVEGFVVCQQLLSCVQSKPWPVIYAVVPATMILLEIEPMVSEDALMAPMEFRRRVHGTQARRTKAWLHLGIGVGKCERS